jgi:hypothetical protein
LAMKSMRSKSTCRVPLFHGVLSPYRTQSVGTRHLAPEQARF